MGRREDREEIQRTWVVYEPLRKGVPIRKFQLDKLADEAPGSFLDEHGILKKPDAPERP